MGPSPDPHAAAPPGRPFRFSLRGLLVATTCAAILLAAVLGGPGWLARAVCGFANLAGVGFFVAYGLLGGGAHRAAALASLVAFLLADRFGVGWSALIPAELRGASWGASYGLIFVDRWLNVAVAGGAAWIVASRIARERSSLLENAGAPLVKNSRSGTI